MRINDIFNFKACCCEPDPAEDTIEALMCSSPNDGNTEYRCFWASARKSQAALRASKQERFRNTIYAQEKTTYSDQHPTYVAPKEFAPNAPRLSARAPTTRSTSCPPEPDSYAFSKALSKTNKKAKVQSRSTSQRPPSYGSSSHTPTPPTSHEAQSAGSGEKAESARYDKSRKRWSRGRLPTPGSTKSSMAIAMSRPEPEVDKSRKAPFTHRGIAMVFGPPRGDTKKEEVAVQFHSSPLGVIFEASSGGTIVKNFTSAVRAMGVTRGMIVESIDGMDVKRMKFSEFCSICAAKCRKTGIQYLTDEALLEIPDDTSKLNVGKWLGRSQNQKLLIF